jgi:hypothetical protein
MSMDAAPWQAALAQLGTNTFNVMFGTNCKRAYDDATDEAYLRGFLRRLRAATPGADIALVNQPEDCGAIEPGNDITTRSMAPFARVKRRLAIETDCAHLNLQLCFGRNIAEYGPAAPAGRNYYDGFDYTHPTHILGQAAMAQAFRRLYSLAA